jgi:hypothetical protein
MKNARCPSGVPYFLYPHPEYCEANENGKHVHKNMLNDCKNLYSYKRSDFGCTDYFSEWALSFMLRNSLGLPETFKDAYSLFSKLIVALYENDN